LSSAIVNVQVPSPSADTSVNTNNTKIPLIRSDASTQSPLLFINNSLADIEAVQILNGNKTNKIHGDKHQIGWASIQTSMNKGKQYTSLNKIFFGIFKCPKSGCEFRLRPRLPKTTCQQDVIPCPQKDIPYKVHPSRKLVCAPCDVKMKAQIYSDENYIDVEHKDTHCHLQPGTIHISKPDRIEFSQVLKKEPHTTPLLSVSGT